MTNSNGRTAFRIVSPWPCSATAELWFYRRFSRNLAVVPPERASLGTVSEVMANDRRPFQLRACHPDPNPEKPTP
jgi:hypothetical protein